MNRSLSEYFTHIAYKKLSAVEANPERSHQHEFNGVSGLREIFGKEKHDYPAVQIYLTENFEEPKLARSRVTWYNAREKHPTRTEYRLYYKSSEVSEHLHEGDLMVMALRQNGDIFFMFAGQGTSAENQLRILFGIDEVSNVLEAKTLTGEHDRKIDSVRSIILQQLGITEEESAGGCSEAENLLDRLVGKFGNVFPATREFSDFARSTLPEINSKENPDEAIVQWWDRETLLFKLFEKYLFSEVQGTRFVDNIEKFIDVSLSIQNRRKSRAGHALENHLEKIFCDLGIPYSRIKVTENNSKPDFIFPGIDQYHNMSYSPESLHMLGVKTSCKDRWRQVLAEANRIPKKHLFTLEPAISVNQTEEMAANKLTLVLPQSLHSSYESNQQPQLLTLADFINLVQP